MPISSIQATIAKLSIKPAGLSAELGGSWMLEPVPAPEVVDAEVTPAPPDGATDGVDPPVPEPPPPGPPIPEPVGDAESSNHVEELPEAPPGEPAAPPAGKQRMNKQNFLQAQPGEGLRGPRPSDDPLSMLDPLWTLNKT
nr:PREDICTED: tyrosine-protein phosphatase non-receptor type 23-like [Apteryx mantelli mantelli]